MAQPRAETAFAAGLTPRDKNGVQCAFWGFGSFFLKKGRLKVPTGTTAGAIPTPPLDSAHLSGWLSASQDTHEKYSNVLLNCMFSVLAVALDRGS